MTLNQIKTNLKSSEYNFLRNNKHLGNNIIILTLGGSHAYGTDVATSDLDIRGCALDTKFEVLTGNKFKQVVEESTDTVIYAFSKLITLLTDVNPNTIEMLGNKPEHYLYVHPIGQELIDNAHMFLSKKAVYSFGGYADQQLRRLQNKSNRLVDQSEQEAYILTTIKNASHEFMSKYFDMPEDSIKLYIDTAVTEGYDTEIFMDINLKHYPLRDYKSMWAEMQSIVKSYSKFGKRNENAVDHDKLGKHMMHLIRLYMMCFDILESEKIITYREKEHDLLMDIRNNKYLDDNMQPIPEFYELLDTYTKRLAYAKQNTGLPDKPNYNQINEFVASVNERIVRGEI